MNWVTDIIRRSSPRTMAILGQSPSILVAVLLLGSMSTAAEETTTSDPKCKSYNCPNKVTCSADGDFYKCLRKVYTDTRNCEEKYKNTSALYYNGYNKIYQMYCEGNGTRNPKFIEAADELDAKKCWADFVVCIAPHVGTDLGVKIESNTCDRVWNKSLDCRDKSSKECRSLTKTASNLLFDTIKDCGGSAGRENTATTIATHYFWTLIFVLLVDFWVF